MSARERLQLIMAWIFELAHLTLLAIGFVVLLVYVLGTIGIGNFAFYYGPAKVTLVKEYRQ